MSALQPLTERVFLLPTATVAARVELLRALLELVLVRPRALDSSECQSGLPVEDCLPLLLDKSLLTGPDLWGLASELEGYSLADLHVSFLHDPPGMLLLCV